jgi:ribosomal subunit interface protein
LRIQIAARHCDVPESVRKRIDEQITRLAKYDPRLSAAEVVFEEERHVRRVEAILSIDRGGVVIARAEAGEFQTAVDKVVDRLGRIVKRQRSQAKSHHGGLRPDEEGPGN